MAARAQNINPEILAWARKQAGLTLEDAARGIGLRDTTTATAAGKLEALERGERFPTRPQLLKMASTYRRSLTTFYLAKPPVVAERGEDFRRLSHPLKPRDSGLLDALLRDVKARQDMVRAILEDDDEMQPLGFVGSITITKPIGEVVDRLRSFLRLEDDPPKGITGPDKLFADLRARIEGKGTFVLLIGNLGSHHTNVSEEIFRGFAIADELAPFIVINDQDAQAARSFTLIHELMHLFVGSTGISGAPSHDAPGTRTDRIERFCNDVAGEFLLPTETLKGFGVLHELDQARKEVSAMASQHHVSEHMVAYRLWRNERISLDHYRTLYGEYTSRWHVAKEMRRQQYRESDGTGPSYYQVRRHRIGTALLELVGRTLRGGELTHSRAARMLGTKISSVEPLLASIKAISGTYTPNERA